MLQRAFELSERELLYVHSQLTDYLSRGQRESTPVEQAVADHTEALTAMDQAAQHLSLPAGIAPTKTQVDDASKDIGCRDGSFVQRAFVRYAHAKEAYLGRPTRESASQRDLRRRTAGPRRKHEEYFNGIRRWLETAPGLERDVDYNDFVDEYNADRRAGEKPLVKAAAIRQALKVSFPYAIAVARGEMTLNEAVVATAERRASWTGDDPELVTVSYLAESLECGRSWATELTGEPAFPTVVAVIGGHRCWVRGDIDAYCTDRPYPRRQAGELQHELMGVVEVADAVGMTPPSIGRAVRRGAFKRPDQAGRRAPMPVGKAGHLYYWRRRDVEEWVAANRELIALRQRDPNGMTREQEDVYNLLVQNGPLSCNEVADALGIRRPAARYRLAVLCRKGIAGLEGRSKRTRYSVQGVVPEVEQQTPGTTDVAATRRRSAA